MIKSKIEKYQKHPLFSVRIPPEILFKMCNHAVEELDKNNTECLGLLLGEWKMGCYVIVHEIRKFKFGKDIRFFESPLTLGGEQYIITGLSKGKISKVEKSTGYKVLGSYHSHPRRFQNSHLVEGFAPSRSDAETYSKFKFPVNGIIHLVPRPEKYRKKQFKETAKEIIDKFLSFRVGAINPQKRVVHTACYITFWGYDFPSLLPVQPWTPSKGLDGMERYTLCCVKYEKRRKWQILNCELGLWEEDRANDY